MSEPLSQSAADTLSTALLDNRGCQKLLPKLHEFENAVFGPDFTCDYVEIQPWVDSGCLFYSAVYGEAVEGQQRILSLASVFLTTSFSRDRLLAGHIADYELAPWTAGVRTEQPTVYFSSVVSDAPHHLAAIYDSLLQDVSAFRNAHRMSFHGGFAIATGAGGYRHMARNGFRTLTGYKYRDKYDLMVIDASTAATPFWRGLLDSQTIFLGRLDSADQIRPAELPSALNPSGAETEARDVQRRLAQAKAERYRHRRDY
ncbi:MAG TPA: hypothetical protein VEO53_01030 [Candidatus Binatia bacterium]|nr:hypothetical protein [Candidatus Binatia bacterium]